MVDPAAFNPAELVPFQRDLLRHPFQHVGFEDFAGKFGARDITQMVQARRDGLLGDYSHVFLLPHGRPDLGGRDGVVEVRKGDGQKVSKLSDQLRE